MHPPRITYEYSKPLADYLIVVVKRRFIRQNREIARINSTQSLRIRNLEAEISRLLSENIAFREQAISSAQEANRLRSSQRIFKDVSRLKEQLESKLSEVGTLMTELGALPERAKRRSSQHQRRKSGLTELLRSPDPKDWLNRQTITGVGSGERQLGEGRLPVIVEGKQYPRQTLESSEIKRLVDDDTAASDSPELGPPPVAHFDVAEPINFAPAQTPASNAAHTQGGYQEHEDDVKPLPGNLEMRRRRRASALLENMPTLNAEVPGAPQQSMSLKSGAKRKLEAREDGYNGEFHPSEMEDFTFQRKAIASETPQARPENSRFTKSGTSSTASCGTTKHSTTELAPGVRKALAPKCTNSPSKSKRTRVNGKIATAKDEMKITAEPRESMEHKRPEERTEGLSTDVQPPKAQLIVLPQDCDGNDPPPKTPVGLDLFSPVSTEPSARTEQQTEIALTASVEDVLGGTDGRTSRRARGAVSYAEPSLRAKMRRPTKDLVAAVGDPTNGCKAHNRESSARAESQERQANEDLGVIKMRTVTIKREKPNESTAWKTLPEAKDEPNSPLVNKVAKPSLKLSPQSEPGDGNSPKPNASTHQIETALENLCILEGPGSSPSDSPGAFAVAVGVQSRKTSRRQSSNPVSLRRVGQEFEKPAAPSARPTTKSGNIVGTSDRPARPSSAASLRKENSSRNDKVVLKRSTSVSTLKPGDGPDDVIRNGGPGGAGTERTERAAARRKSMMI